MRKVRSWIALAFCALSFALMLFALPRPAPRSVEKFAPRGLTAASVQPLPLQTGGMVAINTADADELTVLPGIGETLAQQILDERAAHGLFFYPEDLLCVRGIGTKKLQGMLDYLDFSTAR